MDLELMANAASIIKDISLTTFLLYVYYKSETRRIELSNFIMSIINRLIELHENRLRE